MDGQTMIVAITALLVGGYVVTSFLGLFRKRPEPKGSAAGGLSAETEARIARIEQAVDSIAVEIERISEGQRFTTRLLSERAAVPLPAAKSTVQS
ncbi:MAG TPA: hypothetical protein VFK16_10115 [Gemmatimonadaceae bacterium]|jgi:hypothetical protein|nr:hypothetical protein [Gemmatimonadaceae bacterium]